MTVNPQPAFRALADPTRRDILALLKTREMTIGAVAERFDMTRPAIKKHLSILEAGDLITITPRGRERINAINPDGFRAVHSWLEIFDAFWDDRLAALKSAVEKDQHQ
ncbi:metalloregulator ArsR/SmtB family transcription factor [Fontisubflavum oceani]|uniref:ArsR/SmtB family transcription factor n=1 Tax=Fontisubflavum oceani TaxID=2978973 RepID=UPI0025B28497|nr:metalloregulator ArsR/SmtB family transcription factor [Fontisubflavum oceani]WJY23153.1 metalloregulator ArsR/SmtB family transcription factor [Fontisubflavum oceani]